MSDERVECCVCVYDYEMSAQGIRDERDDTVECGRARLEKLCVSIESVKQGEYIRSMNLQQSGPAKTGGETP